MRTWKIIPIAILAITATALTTASVLAYMGRPGYPTPYTTSTGTTGTCETYPSSTAPYGGYYGRMMGGGMMGGGWGCPGMGTRFGYTAPPVYPSPTTATQLNITTAVAVAQNYLNSTVNH